MNPSRPTLPEFYAGRRVLVTGGGGFIGGNLIAALRALGARITVFDLSEGQSDDTLRWRQGDLRDPEAVAAAVAGQEVLFNLAGRSGAAASNHTPLADLDVNCRGQLTLLEACRQHAPDVRVIFPSSRLVYGTPQSLPVAEDHPLAPGSIYALHKQTVEQYHLLYGRLHGLWVTVARISNPYGPGQPGDRRTYGIANTILRRAARGETITLFGDGSQKRDFFYIADLVDALLRAAATAGARGEIFNIGAAESVSLAELARMATARSGRGRIVTVPWPADYREVETGDYRSDIAKAGRLLGWTPRTPLATGVLETLRAYTTDERAQQERDA